MVKAPVFRIGEQGRSKLVMMNNAAKKRDSYSIPEKWRGKLPSPKESRRSHKLQFPPLRGSLRIESGSNQKSGLPMMRLNSTPVTAKVHLGNLDEKEPLTINLGEDLENYDLEKGQVTHSRSSS